MKPKKYDMSKMSDIKRWFKEMEGYLKEANGGKGFVTDGTDIEGRKLALEGFFQLKEILINLGDEHKLGETIPIRISDLRPDKGTWLLWNAVPKNFKTLKNGWENFKIKENYYIKKGV